MGKVRRAKKDRREAALRRQIEYLRTRNVALTRQLAGKAPKPLHPVYDTDRWRTLRLDALAHADGRCCLCGRGPKDGVVLHVDHIKPISRFPALTWEPSNLQVLCADCNLGKGNRYSTDWR